MANLVRHVVAAFHELRGGFVQPAQGSQGAADLDNTETRRDGSPWGTEPVETYQTLVATLALAIADHLHACTQTMLDDVDFGPAVMARCTLEAAGRAAWLLDPHLDVRERVGRGYALRVRGTRDNARNIAALAALEPDPDPSLTQAADDAAQRWPQVIATAHLLGFKAHRHAETRAFIGLDGLAEPSGDALAYEALRHLDVPVLGAMYASWSAMAHSTYDALRNHLTVVDADRRLAHVGTTEAQRVVAAGLATTGTVFAFDLFGSYYAPDPTPRQRLDAHVLPEIKRRFLEAIDENAAHMR